MLGGVQVAIEETLEDSFCAELVEPAQHGMAFGILATVNGAGDFLSSFIVGLLWSAFGPTLAWLQRAPVRRWRRTCRAGTISSVAIKRQNPLCDQIFEFLCA